MILYGVACVQMQSAGWKWYDAALFGSMIASTDAVAIVAVLKTGARPT